MKEQVINLFRPVGKCNPADAWLGRGNYVAPPKVVWLEFSSYIVDPSL